MLLPKRSFYPIALIFTLTCLGVNLFSQTITLKAETESKGKNLFSASLDSIWLDVETHLKYDLSEESQSPELKAYSLQLTPISKATLSFGSLQTAGLPCKVRNPFFTVARTKAPQTLITPKTLISSSSTKTPESFGIEVNGNGWKTSAEGILKDSRVSRFWMSSEQDFALFGSSKSMFRIGIFCGYSENKTATTTSWFLCEQEGLSGQMFHTAVDFSARLYKTTVSTSIFLHIPSGDSPSPALRAQMTLPVPRGTISAGIFSTEITTSLFSAQKGNFNLSTFKTFEGKTPHSTLSGYIGSEHTVPLKVFSPSHIKITSCICYDKKKPTVWYEYGKPQLTAGTSLAVTTFSTCGTIEYSNTAEFDATGKEPLLVCTLNQALPKFYSGNMSAAWKQTLNTKLLDIHIALKPCSFIQLKSKTSFNFSQEHFIPPEESISLKGTGKLTHTDLEASLSAIIKTYTDIPELKLSIKLLFSP